MDDRYSYPPNYPSRNDLITDFGTMAPMDNMDSMSPYVYTPPTQYNPYHYVPSVANSMAVNSSLFSPHSSSTSSQNSTSSSNSSSCGNGFGGSVGIGISGDINTDSFYSSTNGSDDPFSDDPPLLEELGINFDLFMAKTMLVGQNLFTSNGLNNNGINSKPDQNLLHESELGDLMIDKEDNSSTSRSPNSPNSPNTSSTLVLPSLPPLPPPPPTSDEPLDTSQHQHHHHLPSSSDNSCNNYVDDRSLQVIYQDNISTSNHVCDNLIVSSNNPHGNGNSNGGGSGSGGGGGGGGRGGLGGGGGNDDPGQQVNRSDSQDDNLLINSWEKPMPDELTYPFDSRLRANTNRFSVNPNLNHNLNVNPSHVIPKLHPIGHQFLTSGHQPLPQPTRTNTVNYANQHHHRQILPTLQPTTAAAALTAYPYSRPPVAIQPNLGYTHKVSPRFISPYMTTNVGGRDIIVWASRPNKMYPQQTSTTTSPGGSPHPSLMATSLGQLQEATMATGSVHGRVPIMISAGRVAFTSSPLGGGGGAGDDSSSPSSSCSASSSSSSSSTPPTPGTMDKKIFTNNPLLVNMLTCPQIPGLRNLAPAPDSSSSHLDEKSKSEILSGLIDVSSERRKRSNRTVTTNRESGIKREMRPKIFDIEQFKIGMFHVQSSNEGTARRNSSSTQLKVIFSRRRFIYEFGVPASSTLDKKDQPEIVTVQSTGYCKSNSTCGIDSGSNNVDSSSPNTNNNISRAQPVNSSNGNGNNNDRSNIIYYVIAVPFEIVTGLNIDDSTMYLTVDRVPFLFGGTSVRSKVLFQKAPRFDPSSREIESNALHCLSLRSSQVGRLRSSLIEFDKRFADLLSNKIDRDPFSYRCNLSETIKDSKEEESKNPVTYLTDQSLINHHLHHHQQQQQPQHQHPHQYQQQQQQQQQLHQLPDSVQPLKKQKVIKVDYQDHVESPSQSNNGSVDLS